MKTNIYILDKNKKPIQVSFEEAVKWSNIKPAPFHIRHTKILNKTISTVFLGCNWNLNPNSAPIVFETLAYATTKTYIKRYTTYNKAVVGHYLIVLKVIINTLFNINYTENTYL